MPQSDPGSRWLQFARESLWGRRGLVKVGSLWLPLAALLTLDASRLSCPMWAASVALFVAAACRRVAGTLANDLADAADDAAAGKKRWGQRLPQGVGRALVPAIAAVGVGALLGAGVPVAAVAAYLAATALVLAYSLRPLRFKERGALGPLVFSASCVLLYVATPWLWLSADLALLATLSAAVLLDKWVNLHFHQVVDHGADLARGKRTYAVAVGLARARGTLRWAAGLASAALLGLLACLAVRLPTEAPVLLGASGATLAAAGAHTVWARRAASASALVRELPWHYLGLAYAAFRVLPLILLVPLALRDPAMWLVVGPVLSLFILESCYALRYRYE